MLPPPGTPGTDLPVRAVLPALTDGPGRRTAPRCWSPRRAPARRRWSRSRSPTGPGTGAGGRAAPGRRPRRRPPDGRRCSASGSATGSATACAGKPGGRAATRVEVVTTGLLVRRLQADPELPGVDVGGARRVPRAAASTPTWRSPSPSTSGPPCAPSCELLAMSATAQAERLATLLGATAPGAVVEADRRAARRRAGVVPAAARPSQPPHGTRVDPRLLDAVADTVRRALAETDGDVLVFLPGCGRDRRGSRRRWAGWTSTSDRCTDGCRPPSRTPPCTAGPRRRVVLATDVAETSLTVPGVRVVVDAGLARVPRVDLSRGLGALVTVPASRAAAVQRAGRAGREAPGRVYRLWSAAEHDRLPAARRAGDRHRRPHRGRPGAGLLGRTRTAPGWPCPTRRRPAALTVAGQTLRTLGAVDDDGRVTARGRLADRGRRPPAAGPGAARRRPAGRAAGGPPRWWRCCRPTAARAPTTWSPRWREAPATGTGRWRDEVARLERAVPDARRTDLTDDQAAGLVVGAGAPGVAGPPPAAHRAHLPAGRRHRRRAAPGHRAGRGRSGSRSPPPTGHRDGATPGCGWRSRSTRPPRWRSAARTPTDPRWCGGTATCAAARVERLGAIVLTERPLARPRPRAGGRRRRRGPAHRGPGAADAGPPAATDAPRAAGRRARRARRALAAPWTTTRCAPPWAPPRRSRAAPEPRRPARGWTWSPRCGRWCPWQVAGRLDAVVPDGSTVPGGHRAPGRLRRPGEPDGVGAGAGGLRLVGDPRGRRPAAAAASCCPRPAASWPRPADLRRLLDHRLPDRAQRAARPLPRIPWPEDPARRGADAAGQAPPLSDAVLAGSDRRVPRPNRGDADDLPLRGAGQRSARATSRGVRLRPGLAGRPGHPGHRGRPVDPKAKPQARASVVEPTWAPRATPGLGPDQRAHLDRRSGPTTSPPCRSAGPRRGDAGARPRTAATSPRPVEGRLRWCHPGAGPGGVRAGHRARPMSVTGWPRPAGRSGWRSGPATTAATPAPPPTTWPMAYPRLSTRAGRCASRVVHSGRLAAASTARRGRLQPRRAARRHRGHRRRSASPAGWPPRVETDQLPR